MLVSQAPVPVCQRLFFSMNVDLREVPAQLGISRQLVTRFGHLVFPVSNLKPSPFLVTPQGLTEVLISL
jgi:hypothetical protein